MCVDKETPDVVGLVGGEVLHPPATAVRAARLASALALALEHRERRGLVVQLRGCRAVMYETADAGL